jgi:hypothetical protein
MEAIVLMVLLKQRGGSPSQPEHLGGHQAVVSTDPTHRVTGSNAREAQRVVAQQTAERRPAPPDAGDVRAP